MTLKNLIAVNHIPINKYELLVLGLPAIVFTKMTGIEQETTSTTLPDRTSVSGGQQEPFDVVCEVPLHHTSEVSALESWYGESKDPVTLTYKKTASVLYKSQDGEVAKSYSLIGTWVKKLKYPDTEMANDGEIAVLEVTMSIDDYSAL